MVNILFPHDSSLETNPVSPQTATDSPGVVEGTGARCAHLGFEGGPGCVAWTCGKRCGLGLGWEGLGWFSWLTEFRLLSFLGWLGWLGWTQILVTFPIKYRQSGCSQLCTCPPVHVSTHLRSAVYIIPKLQED